MDTFGDGSSGDFVFRLFLKGCALEKSVGSFVNEWAVTLCVWFGYFFCSVGRSAKKKVLFEFIADTDEMDGKLRR